MSKHIYDTRRKEFLVECKLLAQRDEIKKLALDVEEKNRKLEQAIEKRNEIDKWVQAEIQKLNKFGVELIKQLNIEQISEERTTAASKWRAAIQESREKLEKEYSDVVLASSYQDWKNARQ